MDDLVTVEFDRELVPGELAIANWTIPQPPDTWNVLFVHAENETVFVGLELFGELAPPTRISYAATPPDVRAAASDVPAAPFANLDIP